MKTNFKFLNPNAPLRFRAQSCNSIGLHYDPIRQPPIVLAGTALQVVMEVASRNTAFNRPTKQQGRLMNPIPISAALHLGSIANLCCYLHNRRLMKEDIAPVLTEWRTSRGFDKGSLQVIAVFFLLLFGAKISFNQETVKTGTFCKIFM